jgi:thiamine-phosphate pyrophosphorylase
VKLVQLRVKEAEDANLRAQVTEARDLCRRFGAQLIVNDYWRLALELGCDFVHLGQEDLALADLAAIRRGGLKLGLSTHDEAELATALAAGPDYIALGPVFPTLLKKMPWAPQGLEKIGLWKSKIGGLPLVAIGGLTPERAIEALRAGAQSAAVVTDITLNADPEARARNWVAATRSFV